MKKALLLLGLLLVAGCARSYEETSATSAFLSKDHDAAGAVQTVRDYNRKIAEAYLKNDPKPVRELVDDGEFRKLGHMIEGMQAQKLRLESTLQHLQIDKVDRWGPNNVMVTTSEKWHYRRVNTETGEVVKPFTDIEYHMNYNMIRPKGKWVLFQLAPA